MATHNVIINFGRIWNAKVLSRYTQYSVRLFNRTCLALTIDERRKLSSQAGEEISSGNVMKGKIDLITFSAKKIRNFSIIAHVDHGKSTLADRLLELTGTISDRGNNKQVLDKLQVERERGITVKAQASSMFFKSKGETYLLNLIDTPGHVDFSYEVSRSLAACQGVVLLVDAAQGVQAQTLANYFLARDAGLHIIPVLNKIDLKTADPDKVSQQMTSLFDIDKNEILQVSAKTGQGVKAVIQAIIEEMPSPADEVNGPLKALIFDSWYDQYKGVVCLTAVVSGAVKKGEEIMSSHSKQSYEVMDVGIMYPSPLSTGALYAGQVGYLEMGMRNRKETQIGDTFYHPSCPVDPLPGFQPMRPMVFAGVFPVDQSEFVYLRSAIDKLTLNDSSVTVHPDNCTALGQGWRLGFLGLLHMDVFKQRLEQEYDASVIVTSPSVPYKAILRGNQKPEIDVLNPLELPDPSKAEQYLEPFVVGTLIFPEEYMGKMITLCEGRRGEQLDVVYIDESRIMVKYRLPLSEIILDFYDEIKSQSSGYASFDYEDCGYRPTQVVKMDILINGNAVDALSSIVHIDKAQGAGRHLCSKLKEVIPRQLFEIVIQASVRGRIIARETLRALGKDVTAKCYGGDMSRKMKLIKRQKEGKKKMKRIGKVDIPHKAFLALLKR